MQKAEEKILRVLIFSKAGSGPELSIAKAFKARGHEVIILNCWSKTGEEANYIDLMKYTERKIINKFGKPQVVWASPDCSTYSIAGIHYHRVKNPNTGELDPVSDYAKYCDEVNERLFEILKNLRVLYFIENPMGGLRKMQWVQNLLHYYITYCQYELNLPLEERRQKPTDIWTNHPHPCFKPACGRGAPCHPATPRGSRKGTQSRKTKKSRGLLPKELCQHIVDLSETYYK